VEFIQNNIKNFKKYLEIIKLIIKFNQMVKPKSENMNKNEQKTRTETEQKILLAAREIFLKKGLEGARMQEIADMAGINKALLHYYFRNKENLFMEIIKDAVGDFFPSILNIWGQDIDFDQKVKTFADKYIDFIIQSPDLPRFFINALYQNADLIVKSTQMNEHIQMLSLQDMLDAEAKAGRIKSVNANHFIITLLSLCIFPAIANPLMRMTLNLSENNFLEMMVERKKIVPEIVLNWLEFENNN
jgi:AcrR family transcriptional regulator